MVTADYVWQWVESSLGLPIVDDEMIIRQPRPFGWKFDRAKLMAW